MRALCWILVLLVSTNAFAMDLENEYWTTEGWHFLWRKNGDTYNVRASLRHGIREAVANNNLQLLKDIFLEATNKVDIKNVLNEEDDGKLPVLHGALSQSKVGYRVLSSLLSHGAYPNVKLSSGWGTTRSRDFLLFPKYNAVHVAVRTRRHVDILKLLHRHGADFFAEDEGGWTPGRIASSARYRKAEIFIAELEAQRARETDEIQLEELKPLVNPDCEDEKIDEKIEAASEDKSHSDLHQSPPLVHQTTDRNVIEKIYHMEKLRDPREKDIMQWANVNGLMITGTTVFIFFFMYYFGGAYWKASSN